MPPEVPFRWATPLGVRRPTTGTGPTHHWPPRRRWSMLPGMSLDNCLPRSPELMSAADTGLLVIDVQEKLVQAIPRGQQVVFNVGRLVEGAEILGLPLAATEQYPQGLGPTVPELAGRLQNVPSKLTFSCGGCPEVFDDFRRRGVHKLLLCGLEAHVCVQQTALDLLADGWRVYLAVDAVGSRQEIDYLTALRRMDSAGATLTTTEAALFEWCRVAGTPEFKQISRLAQQSLP
jgi:nicotinamidase-related amidase